MADATNLQNDARWHALQSKVQETKIVAAFQYFRDHNIEPVLLKGWAAARFYPNNVYRSVGDIDLAVSKVDFPAASEIIKSEVARLLNIDVHRELRGLDTLAWSEVIERTELVELNGANIRVLGQEDHLRVLAVHWLIDGGRYKDKLWDIYYSVENRSSSFDWERCLDVVDGNRRRWVICAIGIAHRFLGLKIDDLPFANDARNVPDWVIRTIEHEWRREEDLQPVLASTYDLRLLVRQIIRRLPPNPIRATIEAEGDLYNNRRVIYQIGVLKRRAVPFLKQSFRYLRLRLRRNMA